ncbi:hypothetical protein Q75_09940 [Bacillus coahuilensis p1.1.43]|uniref:Uncharacterized protein n=1 Tax=Bacillus coahuilensis p1.1.43 TaxID=1150625 RepID=A0A147K7C9_9BACI|nr:hypothetical protein [Bacillus coahuilensis]KUP05979.1 hypothetical protein Q75_09940 [Bacillus coahuilensis p1.1.43]
MKRIVLVVIPLVLILLVIWMKGSTVKESIIYFPIDEDARFESATTFLSLEEKKRNGHFRVRWDIQSKLNEQAYLRQDISLLFINGRLKGLINEWEQNTDQMIEETVVEGKESSLFEAITFHYGELHEQNDLITSAQLMSKDSLYIIDSNFSPLNSFRTPQTDSEKEWKDILDRVTTQQLESAWEKSLQELSIDKDNFNVFTLSELVDYNERPLPGFTEEETERLIGNLWEGLYKNYFLGIKKESGEVVEPFDSTIPLLLISKDKKFLYVLIIKDNEPVIFKQVLEES